MQRTATYTDEWTCGRDDSRVSESMWDRVLDEVLGIIKDTLVMSVVVMAGAALALMLW